jgi:hypothetical protein
VADEEARRMVKKQTTNEISLQEVLVSITSRGGQGAEVLIGTTNCRARKTPAVQVSKYAAAM